MVRIFAPEPIPCDVPVVLAGPSHLRLPQQRPAGCPDRTADPPEGVDGDVRSAAFHLADIGPMQPGALRELLLGERAGQPVLTDDVSERRGDAVHIADAARHRLLET